MLRYDKYFIPKDLNEYFNLTEDIKDYRIVAGCTDTLPWAREGRAGDIYFKNIIDVSKIDDLNKFIIKKDKVILGSAITFQKLFLDNDIRQNVKILPQVAVWFADDGCIINNKNNNLVLKLSTESFGKFGAEILSSKLELRFKEKFPIYRKHKNKDQF